MIPEIAHYALILALSLNLLLLALGCLNRQYTCAEQVSAMRAMAVAHCLCVLLSFVLLLVSFLGDDFSVAYVAWHSNTALPILYKLCAIWGAHEGSMLLWAVLLSLWFLASAWSSKTLPDALVKKILIILTVINIGIQVFILATSNPFLRLLPTPPSDGADLNPLLQDFGLSIHPPLLYVGYVGYVVGFAFSLAVLWQGEFQPSWARWSQRLMSIAWCFLTIGIVLGSWWAYRVLGWGGWWFWDPVENASFMPWLAGTALTHTLIAVAKRNVFKAWCVLLGIVTFAFSLLGTFLVRSGVITSVHAFASDPTRGIYMLIFLCSILGVSFALFAKRAHLIKTEAAFGVSARETMMLFNNILLMCAVFTVMLGTLYPLIIDTLHLGKISVGPPYFNAIFTPLMAVLLGFMGFAPMSRWLKTEVRAVRIKLIGFAMLSIILAMITTLWLLPYWSTTVFFGLVLVNWVSITLLYEWLIQIRSNTRWLSAAMICAHVGFIITVLGVILTSAYSIERNLRMTRGETATIGSYEVQFAGLTPILGSNYTGEAGIFIVKAHGKVISRLYANKKRYTIAKMILSEAAIDVGLSRDIYIALGQKLDDNAYAVRVYLKPVVRWIWAGGLLMMLGGFISLFKGFTLRVYDYTLKGVAHESTG